MCKTRTIASKRHFFSLNHKFLCWSPKSPLKVPWRSQTLEPLGNLQRTSRRVACQLSIWLNLCRRYFLFHTAVQLYNVLVLRSLDMKYFSFANVSIPMKGVTHISNLLMVCVKMTLSFRPTNPVLFTSKWQICQKTIFITSDINLV